jgi:DNA-binding transcriptional ArsR family regulator
LTDPEIGHTLISVGDEMTNGNLRNTADSLKALGHPIRLRILSLLRGGELCVCQITAVLELAPSTISEHLGLLRRSGFLAERKQGKWVFYSLSGAPELMALCDTLWPLMGRDLYLESDARACGEIRQTPLTVLCSGTEAGA